jgi:oligopeptide/dipeptide ABC transporter ATP-binding protein
VVHAVNDVSFDVGAARIVGLVGESGCGKSATVRSLLGIVAPPGKVVAGSARFEGRDLLTLRKRELREVRGASISFVAQNPFGSLNPILPVADQFHNMVKAHRSRTAKAETRRLAAEMLEAVGIARPERVLDGYAHELSGGMAQRVVIALAMVLRPRLVIADEPTTALDVTIQRQILDLTQALVLEDGRSMLMVTHDLGAVAQYCDDVVVMYAGKVVERGPVSEVFTTPAHPYTRALLASVPRRGQPVEVLRGRVADLVSYPTGCPFADRCGLVHDRCRAEAPVLRPVAGSAGRTASCHLTGEVEDVRAARTG